MAVVARSLSAPAVLMIAALGGCRLADDPGRHLCGRDQDCLAGRVCLAGVCAAPALDAAVTSDAVAGDGALDLWVAADAVDPSAAAGDAAGHEGDATPPDAASPDPDAPAMRGCGDGVREGEEACDDHNRIDDDLCNNACQWTHPSRLSSSSEAASTCIRTGDLRVVCWGLAGPQSANALQISLGASGVCLIRLDGTLQCPVNISKVPPGKFLQVATGNLYACGLREDGTVVCWDNYVDPATPPGKFRQVAATGRRGCALGEDGSISCWGPDPPSQPAPTGTGFTALALGGDRDCAIGGGRLRCWGATSLDVEGPFDVVAVGGQLICALSRQGVISCWDRKGVAATVPNGRFTDVAAGGDHACALRPDGGITCWGGDNRYWQRGIPRGPFRSFDSRLVGCGVRDGGELVCWGDFAGMTPPPSGKFLEVAMVNTDVVCGLREDHTVSCWGRLDLAALPVDVQLEHLSWPCALRRDGSIACFLEGWTPPPGRYLQLTGSWPIMCGLREDGAITCFNDAGINSPAPPEGAFTSVVAADSQQGICGLRADGSVACTGCTWDTLGVARCGMPIPKAWLPAGPFRKIGVHGPCICGLTAADRMYCWNPIIGESCPPPVIKGDRVRDFSRDCLESPAGALYCSTNKTIDLDDP